MTYPKRRHHRYTTPHLGALYHSQAPTHSNRAHTRTHMPFQHRSRPTSCRLSQRTHPHPRSTGSRDASITTSTSAGPDTDARIGLNRALHGTLSTLATLVHSNHTLSPYTRALSHFTVRSGPRRAPPAPPRAPPRARRRRTCLARRRNRRRKRRRRVVYFRMRDELASVAVSEPGPAYMTYNLGYMGGRGCRFDMPVRRKVSMGILIRGNDIITYIAGEIV